MEITEVRVRLLTDPNDRLKAVCTITLDEQFVIRDMKIVEGSHGLFVAMPSRKLSAGCPRCRSQNHLRAKHCNECGTKLATMPIPTDENGREKAHRDVAHPITAAVRQMLQDTVLEAYRAEGEAAGDRSAPASTPTRDDECGPSAEAPAESVSRVPEEAPVELCEPVHAGFAEESTFGSGLPAEPVDGTGSDVEVVAPVPVGEYGSLIADLKGGAKRRGGEDQKPSSDQREPRKRRRRGSRGGGRDGREDRPKAEERQPRETAPDVQDAAAPPADRGAREEPRPELPKAAPVPLKPPTQPTPAAEESCGFGAGLDEPVEPVAANAPVVTTAEDRREAAAPVEPKEPPSRAQAPSNETAKRDAARCVEEATDDGGFGAGIL